MRRLLAALLLALPMMVGCVATPEVYDTVYDHGTGVLGGTATLVDAPAGFVGSNWVDPYEQSAEDITLADLPGFAFGLTDPFSTLPPPFGTFHAPWKIFVTVVKSFPFVTWSKAEEGGTLTFVSGKNPGPLWYAVGPALEDIDSFAAPVHETVSADHTPTPGNGDFSKYWNTRINSHFSHAKHAGHTLKYLFLNTNSNLPPYDNWFPDQMSRDKTTIHKTFDTFLFGFDWDDPYVN